MEDLKTKISFIAMGENACDDNLAVAICTYFSNHPDRPEDDSEDTESGWGEWVEKKADETIDKIAAVCEEAQRG